MSRSFAAAGAALLVAMNLASAAYAAASEYAFEPLKPTLKKGDDVTLAIRLVHKPTGKPVNDAVIILTRIDMAPDGMAQMTSPVTPTSSTEPGVYRFKTDLTMAGPWLFSVAAKVQGEPETVTSKIIFKVEK